MSLNNLKFLKNGLLLSAVFIGIYYYFVANMAVVEVNAKADNPTLFKIYYKAPGDQYSENRVGTVLLDPRQSTFSFRLTDISNIEEIRIDTSQKPAIVKVKSIKITQPGFLPVKIDSEKQFKELRIGNGVKDLVINSEEFRVTPSSKDPNLFYRLPNLTKENNLGAQCVRYSLLIVFAFLTVFLFYKHLHENLYLLYGIVVVFTLIVVMAVISKYDVHPDEHVHTMAASYFIDHSMPPSIDDPAIRNTFSVYGVSRLSSGEIAYFFAGKFAKLLEPLQLPTFMTLRFFNVSLFGVLLLLALLKPPFRILIIPLLLSPHIWYIFSYFNGEAMAVFLMIITSYQLVVPDSSWNRLSSTDDLTFEVWRVFPLGILLGMFFLLKKNFYFFLLFVFFYFLWRLLFKKSLLNCRILLRMTMVVFIGALLFGSVRFTEHYVNDFKRAEKLTEAQEKYAQPAFKPSTPLYSKFPHLQMKERGVTIEKMFQRGHWGEKTFRTSFGEYGYTSVPSSYYYYNTVRYAGIALLCIGAFYVLLYSRLEGSFLLIAILFSSVSLMGVAFYHSWTVDFQAQGRYLLPIVGMLSIFGYHMRRAMANPPCMILLGTFYILSLYNFISVALAGIDKTPFPMG